MISHGLVAAAVEDAEHARNRADYETTIHLFQDLLERARVEYETSDTLIAVCKQQLGIAYLVVNDFTAAQAVSEELLRMEAECVRVPGFALSAHLLISRAAEAYEPALTALLLRKKGSDAVVRSNTSALLSAMHRRSGRFEQALEEAVESLNFRTSGSFGSHLQSSSYELIANSEFVRGHVEEGRTAALRAATLIRTGHRDWYQLGDFGEDLRKLGQFDLAEEFLREGIRELEKHSVNLASNLLRISLSRLLRTIERYDEAEQTLPAAAGLSGNALRSVLEESPAVSGNGPGRRGCRGRAGTSCGVARCACGCGN